MPACCARLRSLEVIALQRLSVGMLLIFDEAIAAQSVASLLYGSV